MADTAFESKLAASRALRAVLAGQTRWTVQHGDLRDVLPLLPDDSIDSCVCDPPYELGFMAKGWDASGVAFDPETWRALFRVMKPGAHLLAFGGTRTYHRIACAIEDAGFRIRDSVGCFSWAYGSGFPKSLNVSRAIDEADGLLELREIVHRYTTGGNAALSTAEKGGTYVVGADSRGVTPIELTVTRGASDKSRAWDGWGTALKPAWEPVIVARKPLDGSVVVNVLEHGTGGINIDACRVATDWATQHPPSYYEKAGITKQPDAEKIAAPAGNGIECHPGGRWPPNVLLVHHPICKRGPDGYDCHPGCAVGKMDRQSGESKSVRAELTSTPGEIYGGGAGLPSHTGVYGFDDAGTASRYFPQFEPDLDTLFLYCAKACRAERELGCESLPARTGAAAVERAEGSAGVQSPRAGAGRTAREVRNAHPTIKPIELMRWLVRLVTPRDGVCLDLFTGSGTTGIAAWLEDKRFVGIELNDTPKEPYVSIARARIAYYVRGGNQLDLFAGVA